MLFLSNFSRKTASQVFSVKNIAHHFLKKREVFCNIIDTEAHFFLHLSKMEYTGLIMFKMEGRWSMKPCESQTFFLSMSHMSFVFFNSVCSFLKKYVL